MAYLRSNMRMQSAFIRAGTLVVVGAVLCGLTLGAANAQKRKGKRKGKKAGRPPVTKPIKVDVAAEARKLLDPKPDVAAKAAEMLGKTRDKRAVGHLLDALATGLHPRAAAAALGAVGAHGDVKALDTVAFYARYRDPKVRAAAVTALGALDDSRAVEKVLTALRDGNKSVRAAAASVIADRNIKRGIEPMLELLKRGDEGTVQPLAKMADPDLARAIGELVGVAPDAYLARCLGLILLKPDFKPESARVQVVRTLGKLPGTEAVEQLTTYIEKVPEKPPRQSRREAEALIEARLTGGM